MRGQAPEVQLAARTRHAAPIVEALKPWFEKQLSAISSGSTLAGDIRYALGHWPGLTRFLERALRVLGAGLAQAERCAWRGDHPSRRGRAGPSEPRRSAPWGSLVRPPSALVLNR
ncbi:hypothetical protein ABIE65_005349 [Constrictibacter sp. MBR-5]